MPDTDTLQIINTNIDSIDAEDVGDSEWHVNTSTAQESNTKQETDGPAECCANTDSFSKSNNNSTESMVDNNSKDQQTTFFQVQTVIQTKKGAELTQ